MGRKQRGYREAQFFIASLTPLCRSPYGWFTLEDNNSEDRTSQDSSKQVTLLTWTTLRSRGASPAADMASAWWWSDLAREKEAPNLPQTKEPYNRVRLLSHVDAWDY